MDRRSFAAIALCILFYLGYQHYLKVKYPDYGKPKPQTSSETSSPAPSTAGTTSATAPAPSATGPGGAVQPAAPQQAIAADQLTIDTDVVSYRFNADMSALEHVVLKHYEGDRHEGEPTQPIDLLDTPLTLQGTLDGKVSPPTSGWSSSREGRTFKFWKDQGAVRVTQELKVPEQGYTAELRVAFTNIGQQPLDLTAGLQTRNTVHPKKKTSVMGIIPGTVAQKDQVIYRADGSTEWKDLEKFCGDTEALTGPKEPIGYLGLDRHYFLAAVQPKAKAVNWRIEHEGRTEAGCPLATLTWDAMGTLQPNETATLEYGLYFGPKDPEILRAASPELDTAMHLGTFGFIARPLLQVIKGFYNVLHNYGLAIILLTLCLKLLFYPLMRASSTSMHKMKKLNPQMNALKEKYKDDKQRQQQELMKFMMANKINPMKGCLPILPQIPVFFAFYQVLQTSIELRHAPFIGWIHDLSSMDPYFVTPLLMGVAMFVQQKLTPTTGMDKTQEKILMFMPIMFTAMMLTLPAGLTLYMLTNTVTGIAQQKWLYYRLEKAGA